MTVTRPARRRYRKARRRPVRIAVGLNGITSTQLSKIIFRIPKRFRVELVHEATRRHLAVSALIIQVFEVFMADVRARERTRAKDLTLTAALPPTPRKPTKRKEGKFGPPDSSSVS